MLIAYAWLVTTDGLAPLTRRAVGHAVADMRNSVRLQGRALPMLLFATLFFFTGELWQAMNRMAWWRVELVLGLFAGVTVLASGVRLREEIGRVEQDLSPARLIASCRGTPLEAVSAQVVPAGPVPLGRRQVGNLLLMLAAPGSWQFFAPILDEVERTLGVRAVYLAVRTTPERAGEPELEMGPAGTAAGG